MSSIVIRSLFLTTCLVLQSCESKISDTPYFPLEEGLKWEYQISQKLSGGSAVVKRPFTLENLGRSKIKNGKEIYDAYLRQTSDGNVYYFVSDNSGMHRVAKRTVVEFAPRFDEVIRKVLPSQQMLDIGQLWNVDTSLYVMHSRPDYNNDLSDKRPSMVFEVESLDDTVDVPAGRFENCIRVEGYASVTLYADARIGYIKVPILQTEWYAPNVGLVKMIRSEVIDSMVYQGGVHTFELTKFTH